MVKKLALVWALTLVTALSMGTLAQAQDTVLRYGFDLDVQTWDPSFEQSNVRMIYYPMYDTLVTEDIDGTIIPAAAESWEETATTVDFTLREGLTFTDGEPLNAEAVSANLIRVRDGEFGGTADKLASIESIDVTDDLNLRLNLANADPALMGNLARFSGMLVSPAAFETAAEMPVGSGPYIYNAEESIPQSVYVFDANPDYWNPDHQNFERFEIVFLGDATAAVNGMLTGELDVAAIGGADLAAFEGTDYVIHENEAWHFGFHILDRDGTMVPELADERVRCAMAHAIPREEFFLLSEDGYGIVSTQRHLPGQYGHAEEIADLTYDLERAQTLMDEAGVEGFTITVPSFPVFDRRYEVLDGYFSEIGISLQIEQIPGAIFPACASGDFPAAICPLNELHVSTFVQNRVLSTGFLNPFGVVQEDLEEMAQEAAQLSPDDAEPLWSDISRLTAERCNILHVGAVTDTVVARPGLEGAEARLLMPGVADVRRMRDAS